MIVTCPLMEMRRRGGAMIVTCLMLLLTLNCKRSLQHSSRCNTAAAQTSPSSSMLAELKCNIIPLYAKIEGNMPLESECLQILANTLTGKIITQYAGIEGIKRLESECLQISVNTLTGKIITLNCKRSLKHSSRCNIAAAQTSKERSSQQSNREPETLSAMRRRRPPSLVKQQCLYSNTLNSGASRASLLNGIRARASSAWRTVTHC